MNGDVLSRKYTGSSDRIKKGDSVFVEDRGGLIKEVCLPHTKLARDYSCEKTGGILVLFDDGILELLPFGLDYRIKRRSK